MMKLHRKTISNAQTLGERLRRARRRKKISLETAEELTKIRARYLEALEKEEFTHLPSDVYVRGFLTTYSNLLGLDVGEILNLYKKEKSIQNPQLHDQIHFKGEVKIPKFIFTPRIILIALAVILFLSLSGYFWYQVSGFAAAPKLEIFEPTQLQLSTGKDNILIKGNTDSGASVNINDQPVGLDLTGNFEEKIILKKGLNQIKVQVKNKLGKETIKNIEVLAEIPEVVYKPRTAGEKTEISERLKLTVLCSPNAAWLMVKVDSKEVYRGIMLPKTSQEFEADNEIIFNTGNAGSTRLYLNGHDLGNIGDEGEAKKNMKFDRAYLDQLEKNITTP